MREADTAGAGPGRIWLTIKLAGTLAVSAWIVSLVDWSEFWAAVADSILWILGVVTAMRFGGIVLSALKWQEILVIHSVDVRFGRLLRWYLVGSFLNHFLPGSIGGDGYRIYKTWRNERSRAAAVVAVLVERVTGFGALALLGYAAALALSVGAPPPAISALVVVGSLALVAGPVAVALASRLRRLDRLRRSKYWQYVEGLTSLARDFRDAPGKTGLVAAISFVFHLNKLAATWLILYALGARTNPLELMAVLLLTEVAGLLPISLGGLGVVEGSFILLMGPFGVGEEVAFATMLLLRVLMLPFYLAGAVFYFVGDRAEDRGGARRKVQPDAPEEEPAP